MYLLKGFVLLSLIYSCQSLSAELVRVAAASNFRAALTDIASAYEQHSGTKLSISFGSTGKHYAQIINGAPFDIFFAADDVRPALLEKSGRGMAGSRFTYAKGRLVLWSARDNLIHSSIESLKNTSFRYIAIGNPKLAPYGRAARQVIEGLGLWDKLQKKLVRGENIAQTFEFVRSGNADLGFVALSQIIEMGDKLQGKYLEVNAALYDAINQQAIVLNSKPEVIKFAEYVKGEKAREIIRGYGYYTGQE